MSRKFNFDALFLDAEKSTDYWVERAVLEFTDDVVGRLEAAGINRAELARRIGVSSAYVTKILRGNTNFTLESMVRISQALGCSLRTHLQPEGAWTHWFDLIEASPVQAGVFKNCAAMNRQFSFYTKCVRKASMENNNEDITLAS